MNITVQANRCFKEVDLSRKRYVVMKGSAGSGKSVDTAQNYILRLMTDPGRNLLCVRKADVTNRDSTFAELQGAIFRMFGEGYSRFWYINSSGMKMRCKLNGNEIIFRGVNDDKQREKLKSITFKKGKLTDVWIEEATEITQADFEIIDDRLRGELPDGQFYQIRMTFNPVSASHWIKKVFFDRDDPDVMTHSSTYLMNRFIDEAYHRRMERRKEVDPEGYKVYGLGEWGETSGLILSNWKVVTVPTDLSWYDDVALGQDFGFNHANAIYLYGYKDGNIYVIDGLYGFEKDTTDWIREADKKKLPKKKVMWCDSAEPDRIKMWCDAGYKARPVRKEKGQNDKGYQKAQIDWLKGAPVEKDDRVIKRMIYIAPHLINFKKEIEQWKWKLDTVRNEYTDEPVPVQDDAMASLRYGVEGWRKKRSHYNRNVKGGI